MGSIKERTAYLRGLAEGMAIGEDSNGKLINAIIATLEQMADSIEENEAAIAELDECMDDVYDDLDAIDEYLFSDEGEFEDDFAEVECPHCGETIYFDEDMLENSDDLICPCCNESVLPEDEDA